MLTADNTGVLHNFSPGPALLPAAVLEQAAVVIADFCGAGLSLLLGLLALVAVRRRLDASRG